MDTRRRIDELSYERGYLLGTIKHVEAKLERLRGMSCSGDVLAACLSDAINDLQNGREKAPEAAKTHARELWIDRRIDQEKMDAADDAADAE
jgi:hypothetical protein